MYEVSDQIITQLCVFTFLYVIYTAISLFNITNKVTYCSKMGKKDKTLTNVMFCLLLFMCVICNNNGDYYSYYNWFIHTYGETAETDEWIEPIYYWIRSVIPSSYLIFRAVVWGCGIFVYKKLCEKIGLNLLLSYILFGVFYVFAYSYARASLGIMVTSYAFVILISQETKYIYKYVKVILLFTLATLLHKSCLSLIFILLPSLLLKFNKRTFIILAVLYVPLIQLLNSKIGIISIYIGLSESQAEGYFRDSSEMLDRSAEIYKYIPILILLIVSIIKMYKHRNVLNNQIKHIIMATIFILYVATILLSLPVSFVQTIAIRFYLMAFVLGLICCIYAIQNLRFNKLILISLIIYCAIYYCYHILVAIKYGAPQLVERYLD